MSHVRSGHRALTCDHCWSLEVGPPRPPPSMQYPVTSQDRELDCDGFVTTVTANRLTKLAAGDVEGIVYQCIMLRDEHDLTL